MTLNGPENSISPEYAASQECIIATTDRERDEVYRLRYACYRRKGSIDVNSEERFSDPFDEQESNFSFLVRGAQQESLATVRISVVLPSRGWKDSPAQHVYGDHPELQRMSGESYVEASRLCFGPRARRDAFVRLLGNMAALADFYEVGWLVACPRVEHSDVYQRMFGFRPLAAPRKYYGVNFETQLLGIRRSDLHNYVRGVKPMTNACVQAMLQLAQSTVLPTFK